MNDDRIKGQLDDRTLQTKKMLMMVIMMMVMMMMMVEIYRQQ